MGAFLFDRTLRSCDMAHARLVTSKWLCVAVFKPGSIRAHNNCDYCSISPFLFFLQNTQTRTNMSRKARSLLKVIILGDSGYVLI
jgi:hypothetical protein